MTRQQEQAFHATFIHRSVEMFYSTNPPTDIVCRVSSSLKRLL